MDIEGELCSFIVDTTFRDVPDEAIEFTKHLALKTAAGMVAGSNQPAGRRLLPYVNGRAGIRREAGVFASGFETTLDDAVLANGTFAHASELEDDKLHPTQDTSWDITTFPLTFGLAEKYRLSGRECLLASAIGMEVLTRIGLPPNREVTPDVGIQGASAAAAAAASKAMRLDEDATRNALGLAIGGPPLFLPNTGTDAHFLDSAFQCVRGLKAAELAKEGVTGNPDFELLYDSLYAGTADDASDIVDGIGEEWLFRDIGIKKYPVCFFMHRYIDVLRELVAEHDLDYEDVESVEIFVGSQEDARCNRPDPGNVDDAKFSYHHVLSAVLLEGDVGYDQVTEETIVDPTYEEARSKVTVTREEGWTKMLERPARVVVTLRDGTELAHEREHMIGSREEPLDDDQLRNLYRKFTKDTLPESVIERTADDLVGLEALEDMQALLHQLTYREPRASAGPTDR